VRLGRGGTVSEALAGEKHVTNDFDELHSTILAAHPKGSRITAVNSYRPGYLPYPARVTLEGPGGATTRCVVKVGERQEAVFREAHVLGRLLPLGLPVPAVLAGPVALRSGAYALVLSELPGDALPWVALNDLAKAEATCRLVHEGIDTLHGLTNRLLNDASQLLVPHRALAAELALVREWAVQWTDVPLLGQAVELLQEVLPCISTPLVFSNGDYNPLNYLQVGGLLTGFVDFEHSCFEDPYIGLAKFILWSDDDYGWGAGKKIGLVERYLYSHGVTPFEFLPRLVLRGLRHLQERAAETQPGSTELHGFMFDRIAEAVATLRESPHRKGALASQE
jgi:hypothetical protein